MKKILSVAAAIALAAALISCGDTSDFDGATDTVIAVGTPKVTAKAYPGVNYISWEPIAQAKAYELYRLNDGAANTDAAIALSAGTNLQYADIANNGTTTIVDGKSYKYVVIAVGANGASTDIPTRAVYLKSSQGSATVTAKVPQSGTTALDLNKSYASKLNDKNVAKNVKAVFVEEGENAGKIYYEFPATAGYKYAIAFLADGVYESTGVTAVGTPSLGGKYLEDYKVEGTNTPDNPGKYNVYIAVDSVANALYPTSYVKTGVTVEVAKLAQLTSPTTGTSATYTTEKTARVYWTPAKAKAVGVAADDGAYFPVENYKVYRKAENAIEYTLVEGTVTAGVKTATTLNTANTTIYYIDDTVADNTVSYTYKIVLTDGVRYGTAQTATLNKRAKTGAPSLAIVKYNFDKDGLTNDIRVTVTAGAAANSSDPQNVGDKVKDAKTVTLYWINLAEKETKTAAATWNKVELTKTKDDNYDAAADTYIWYKENAEAGVYLFKAVAHEVGYLDSDETFTTTTVNGFDTIVADMATATSGYATTLSNFVNTTTDAYSNYEYKLLTVTTNTAATTGKKTVSSSDLTPVTLTATGTYEIAAQTFDSTVVGIEYYLIRTRK